MEKEVRFQEMLKDLCMLARVNKNTVTRQLVEEFFEELQLSKEQMKHIYAYLKEQKIQVLREGTAAQQKERAGEPDGSEGGESEEDGAAFDERIAALCQEVLNGDNTKKQEILQAYQPKMQQYIQGFLKSGLLEEDLLQEAGLGLLLALESLTLKSGDMSFTQYLETGIENEIRMALEEEFQAERADEELEKKVNRFHGKLLELGEELGRKPAVEEVCMYMKLSKEEVDYYFRLMGDGEDSRL